MDKSLLIATLGSRDLQIDRAVMEVQDEEIQNFLNRYAPRAEKHGDKPIVLQNLREACKELNQNEVLFEKMKKHLRFPLLEAALAFIREFKNFKIEMVYFIATDQKNNKTFRAGDTIELAKLIRDKHSYLAGLKSIRKPRIIAVTDNVTDYDRMYDFFGTKAKEIEQRIRSLNQNGKSKLHSYILAQGGIDAINVSLLLRCIEYLPGLEQLVKTEGSEWASVQKFPLQFKQNIKKHTLRSLANAFDFAAMDAEQYTPELSALARLGHYLFLMAWDKLHKAWSALSTHKEFLQDSDIQNLQSQTPNPDNEEDLIKLAWAQAKIYKERDDWNAFLFKLFTIADNILDQVVEKKFGTMSKDYKQRELDWKEILNKNPELNEFLSNKSVKGYPLDFTKPNRLVMEQIIIEYGLWPEGLEELYNSLNKLSVLRNNVAHRLRGYSEEDIVKVLGGKEGFKRFIAAGDRYFGVEGHYIFDEIREKINNMLT